MGIKWPKTNRVASSLTPQQGPPFGGLGRDYSRPTPNPISGGRGIGPGSPTHSGGWDVGPSVRDQLRGNETSGSASSVPSAFGGGTPQGNIRTGGTLLQPSAYPSAGSGYGTSVNATYVDPATGTAYGADPQSIESFQSGEDPLWGGKVQSPMDAAQDQRDFDAALVPLGEAGGSALAQTPKGNDFTSPGVGVQTFQNQQHRYTDPGVAQQWYSQTPLLNGPTQSQQAYDQFSPQLTNPASLDPYYDRAKTRAASSINDQLAARGSFGSSAGMNILGSAMSDLDASQAQQQSQYDLSRIGLGGQLAGQADTQGLSQYGLGANVAQGIDAADLARLVSGQSSALEAEAARRGQGQDAFTRKFLPSQAVSQVIGQGMSSIMGSDDALINAIIGLALGEKGVGITGTQNRRDNRSQDIQDAKNLFGITGNPFD